MQLLLVTHKIYIRRETVTLCRSFREKIDLCCFGSKVKLTGQNKFCPPDTARLANEMSEHQKGKVPQ